MAFLDTPRFPDSVAIWATGGRGFSTTVVETLGGQETRNANWTNARGKWNVSEALRTVSANGATQLAAYNQAALRNYFRVSQGQLYGFRFKDFSDFKDEGFGVFSMLTATTFQMYKQYALGAGTGLQIIQKPVSGTVVVTGGVTPSVNYTTGVVTVASGTPTAWTGEFDIPCRFAEDFPDMGMDASGALFSWRNMNLIEIRDIS
jgi:uncharacterized protein (TIGR02217 family)